MIALATTYGRYGYRRIPGTLRTEGFRVNHKRVEGPWRREGLKEPPKQPKPGRLWLDDGSFVRLRPERPNLSGPTTSSTTAPTTGERSACCR